MDVVLTEEAESFVRAGVEGGRYRSAEDAVREAIEAWVEMQRERAELQTLTDEGMADLEAGRYEDYSEEELRELFEEIKAKGRAARD